MKPFIKFGLIALLVGVFIPTTKAATTDDIRELLGRDRVDKVYTEEQVLDITKKYMQAERNNIVAKMFEIGEKIEMDDYESDKVQLLTAINLKKEELNKAFCLGESTEKVLALKTELDNLMQEVNRLKQVGYTITVDFEPNPYTEDYLNIQTVVEQLGEQYDIGDVGLDMKSPLQNSFLITSPFGTRIDPITGETALHNALDLGASHREPVLAQWNGVVTQAFFSETGGNMVVIAHGQDLVTRYLHMDELAVKVGDIVNQYDVIGYAGSTGRSTGTHLHLEVILDDILVNPLMLYGTKGLNAFKQWLSLNPNQLEDTTFMQNIKDRPSEVVVNLEKVYRGYDAYIAPTYNRSEASVELDFKEKMELKEQGLITSKDLNKPLTTSDKAKLLEGDYSVLEAYEEEITTSFSVKNEEELTGTVGVVEGEMVYYPALPTDYTTPNPGFPLLSEVGNDYKVAEKEDVSLEEDGLEDGSSVLAPSFDESRFVSGGLPFN